METVEGLYRLSTRLPVRTPPTTSFALSMLTQQLDLLFRTSLISDAGLKTFAAMAAEMLADPDLPAAAERVLTLPGDDPAQPRQGFVNDVAARIGGPLDQSFMERFFARLCRDLNEPAAEGFARLVNAAGTRAGGPGSVVMVANTCYNVIWREAWALRRRGFRVFLICLNAIPEDRIASFSEAFDNVFHGCDNYLLLDLILSRLDADIIHVQCRMWEYVMARFVLERKRRARVICEFYDITGIVSKREAYYRHWLPAAVDLELDCERMIFRESDGIVHRFPTDLIAEHAATYGRVPPQIEMQQYPLAPLIQSRAPASQESGRIRCVYIGGVVPRNDRHRPEFYPNWGAPAAWEVLLEAGISVAIYYTPYGQSDMPGFEFLVDMQKRYPHFEIKPTLPANELAAGIADYDFGLIVNDLDMANTLCRPELYKGGVGTKLFHYLEAGLPILINSEYEYATSIIEENGMGLSVSSEALDTLPEKIARADRFAMRENVARFSAANHMDLKISNLIDLYGFAGAERSLPG